MVQAQPLKKVVVLLGPTGVGKSQLAVRLAHFFKMEIINADPEQMRKGLNIGTAKLSNAEMDGVKHHFIDFLAPGARYSVKQYQKAVRALIDQNARLYLIVGGSGLYIGSVIKDYHFKEEEPDPSFLEKYAHDTDQELFAELKRKSPDAAKMTHPHNRRRVLRYLQLINSLGYVPKEVQNAVYDALVIYLSLDRNILYERINARTDKMFLSGWIDEVKGLIQNGVDLQLIDAIGYKEIASYLEGKMNITALKALIKQKTRNYAKRQITWFKNKTKHIEVVNDENAYANCVKLIQDFLLK